MASRTDYHLFRLYLIFFKPKAKLLESGSCSDSKIISIMVLFKNMAYLSSDLLELFLKLARAQQVKCFAIQPSDNLPLTSNSCFEKGARKGQALSQARNSFSCWPVFSGSGIIKERGICQPSEIPWLFLRLPAFTLSANLSDFSLAPLILHTLLLRPCWIRSNEMVIFPSASAFVDSEVLSFMSVCS